MNLIEKIIDFLDPIGGIAKICGIAGVALVIFYLLLKLLIKKATFASLTQSNSYKFFRLFVWLCFGVAVIGMLLYTYTFNQNRITQFNTPKVSNDSLSYQQLKLEKKGVIILDSVKHRK